MNTPRILIVDDDPIARKNLSRILRKESYQIVAVTSGFDAIDELQRQSYDVVLTDLVMDDIDGVSVLEFAKKSAGDIEVIIITGYGSVKSAIETMKKGAYHYLVKPFHAEEVRHLTAQALEKQNLQMQIKKMQDKSPEDIMIIGQSNKITHIINLVKQVAPTDANVLITGESGTGKELIASAIHNFSRRCTEKFLAINCASFTEELMANEFFGHEKGAYTGATAVRCGLLETADKGTIFFDEVGDMPYSLQGKLLRVIQEHELIRVGGNKPVQIDVRIIAATNQNLKQLVDMGRFRQDLYYRLHVIGIHLPPLCKHKEDIPILLGYILSKVTWRMKKKVTGFSETAVKLLMDYDYPGNVRELENIVERATALCRKEVIDVADLPQDLKQVAIYRYDYEKEKMKSLAELERDYIQWVLKRVSNKSQAAKILGIDRVSLYRKLKKYQLRE